MQTEAAMAYQGKDNEKKIPYDRWVYAKSLMDRLREEGGLSMTELSREACGNGDTPGWAQSAYEHRSIVREHQIRNMERLLLPKPKKGVREGDVRLSRDAQKRFQALVVRLRDYYGWDNHQIGSALNVHHQTVSRMAHGHGGGTLSVLHRAQEVVDRLDQANRNGHVEEPAPVPAPALVPTEKPAPTVQAAVGRPSALQAARAAGHVFQEALAALEADLPAFARPGAADLRKRVAAVIADLGTGD